MTGAADTIVDVNVAVKRCPECGARFGAVATFCPFCGVALSASTWDPSHDPLTGTIVDGRYEVIGPIGEGGMGTVYNVRHVALNRHFAMKLLRKDLADDAGLSARFVQEARATAAIKHPSVVAITDFGVLGGGVPYFVMELLIGETLATYLRARGTLSPPEATKIARLVANALAASHDANVVHRDLKPDNVFLVGAAAKKAPSDEIRVVDFGAAKIVGASKLTRPGVVFGTPYYMSPEQASGQPTDARSDVYSLGVLLYQMLTGRVPFEADTYMGVLTQHLFAAPARPSTVLSAADASSFGALEDVVLRALEKDPAQRFPSMQAFAEALASVDSKPASPASARSDSGAKRTVRMPTLSTAERIERSVTKRVAEENRRTRTIAALLVLAATVTLAVLGAMFMSLSRAPAAPEPAPDAKASSVASAPTAAADPGPIAPGSAEAPPASASAASVLPVIPTSPPAPPPAPARPKVEVTAAPAARPAPPARPPTSAPSPPPALRRGEEFSDPWRK